MPTVLVLIAPLGLVVIKKQFRIHVAMVFSSHTRIFQVPSEMMDDVIQERIDQVRRR